MKLNKILVVIACLCLLCGCTAATEPTKENEPTIKTTKQENRAEALISLLSQTAKTGSSDSIKGKTAYMIMYDTTTTSAGTFIYIYYSNNGGSIGVGGTIIQPGKGEESTIEIPLSSDMKRDMTVRFETKNTMNSTGFTVSGHANKAQFSDDSTVIYDRGSATNANGQSGEPDKQQAEELLSMSAQMLLRALKSWIRSNSDYTLADLGFTNFY